MAEDRLLNGLKDNIDIPLSVLDSIHDFCTKERKKKETESTIEDDEEPSQGKVDFMRDYLINLLNNDIFKEKKATTINDVITSLTEGNVTTISNFENQVVSYYETSSNLKSLLKTDTIISEKLTFQTIIDAYKTKEGEKELGMNSPLWIKYRLNRNSNFQLEINKGTKSIETYTQQERNIIGNFILNYFFADAISPVKCTFDAKAGVVGKIFNDFEQVRNIIFPQTIADSATTSFTAMKGRNDFLFPTLMKPFPFVSNYYTKDIYTIFFENFNFTPKNPYGFLITIQRKGTKDILSLPFSETQTEGPSVNYLIEILEKIKATAKKDVTKVSLSEIKKKKQILSLGKYIDTKASPEFKKQLVNGIWDGTNGLLLDLKRGGDHEAAAVTAYVRQKLFNHFIFVTIDLLCALESRRRQNPTIWHFGERMLLYRFPLSEKESERTQQLIVSDRINTAIEKCALILTLFDEIKTQILKVKQEAIRGKEAYVSFVATQKDRIQFTSVQTVPRKYQEDCEKVLTKLLRLRMTSLESQVIRLESQLQETFQSTLYPEGDEQDEFTASFAKIPLIQSALLGLKTEINKRGKKPFAWPPNPEALEVTIESKKQPINTVVANIETLLKTTLEKINSILEVDIPLNIDTSGVLKKIELYNELLSCRDTSNRLKLCGATTSEESKVYCFEKEGYATYSENSSFNYNSQPFFEFYKTLLELSKATDTAISNNSQGSRVYTNVMKREAPNLKKSAQQILNQMNDAEKTILRTVPFFQLDENPLYLTHDPIFENFFGNFDSNTDFFSSMPVLAIPVAGGVYPRNQVGGFDGQQFYDCADLLLEISTKASVFLEASYCVLYPVKAFLKDLVELHNQIQLLNVNTQTFLDSNKSSKIRETAYDYVENHKKDTFLLLQNSISQANYFYENYFKESWWLSFFVQTQQNKIMSSLNREFSALGEMINESEHTPTLYRSFEYCYENLQKFSSLNQLKEKKPEPSVAEFFSKLVSFRDETGEAVYLNMANSIQNDMQIAWETGFLEIQTNELYDYEASDARGEALTTDELLTVILSIQMNGDNDSVLLKSNLTSLEETKAAAFTAVKTKLSYTDAPTLPILFLFTLLENIQNPDKFSYFLKGDLPDGKYQNIYYNSKRDWNIKLWTVLNTFVRDFPSYLTTQEPKVTIPRLVQNAGFSKQVKQQYPRETRKQRKHKTRGTRRKQ